jgi:MFS family permease
MRNLHPLLKTLFSLKGNQRACVYTEPLWALPNNLILPFASIYMASVGLNDAQIGLVASFGLAMQFLWALFSGAIVDKFGRRSSMMVFGIISWTIPCILWAVAQGYWYFMIAVFFNSMWRVMGNSFSCMIIEDEDSTQLINIYTIFNFIGILAGFISPIIGLLIDRFTLLPTIRGVYFAAMILMTIKFLLQYRMARESEIGKRRSRETREKSMISLTFGGWNVFIKSLGQTKLSIYVLLIILTTCFSIVQDTFWPLFITTAYGVSASMLSVFPLVKTIMTMIVYVTVTSRIKLHSIRYPLLAGLGANLSGLAVLVLCLPFGSSAIWAVFFSAICDAFAIAILSPLFESLMTVNIPSEERARVNSLITGLVLLISIPVGGIAGVLSQHNRVFPLMLNAILVILEILIAVYLTRGTGRTEKPSAELQDELIE